MANIRIFAITLILLIIVNCTLIQGRTTDNSVAPKKGSWFCSKAGKKCGGLFSKSCCHGLVCNRTTHKCVCEGSSTSWLCDRNGK